MNHDSTNSIPVIAGTLFVAFIIVLICREIVCWYWKVNRAVDLLEKIHAELVAARQTANQSPDGPSLR